MSDEDLLERMRQALKEAITEADGWYDECHGGLCPNISAQAREMAGCKDTLDWVFGDRFTPAKGHFGNGTVYQVTGVHGHKEDGRVRLTGEALKGGKLSHFSITISSENVERV